MTILTSELKFYKSKVVGSGSTNGGRMSAVEAISGVVNNLWPHVLKAERDAGSELYRKVFPKVANDDDDALLSPDLWNDVETEAGDYIILFPGTQRDTQADWAAPTTIYGCCNLNSDLSSGGSTFDLLLPHADMQNCFPDGRKIRLTDMADPESGTGNEELLTVNGTPTLNGLVLTVTVDETIGNSYTTAAGGRVMSLYSPGDIEVSVDNWVETCAGSGTYDESSYPVVLDNIGTVEQTVTITFTDATSFTATSDDGDVTLGSGTTGADFAPNNPDFTKPYLALEKDGFAGTWAADDTIVFQTHPAAAPFVLKRVVPAGCGSLAGNKNTTALSGEAA